MELQELSKKVNIAIDILYERDFDLIKYDIHERSITAHLANYLEILFRDYDVDCEYNRHIDSEKKLETSGCSVHNCKKRALPDILIHNRRNDDNNLLVIECKKKESKCICDQNKLKSFTNKDGTYKYNYGLFIEFNEKRRNIKLEWFKNGSKLK